MLNLLSCIMGIYYRVEELNIMHIIKIREKDVIALYSLVKTLEDLKSNESAVLLICRTFMIPTILAIHPDNNSEVSDPQRFLKVLQALNPVAYIYRIGKVI